MLTYPQTNAPLAITVYASGVAVGSPHVQDFTANLAGVKVFSKMDLVRSYHRILVHNNDIPKMVVIAPFGLWEFLRKTFGLKNAAQTFQRFMDTVVQGLDLTFVYIDDILVASHSKAEHGGQLQQRFQRLQQHGLVLNLAKCQFGKQEINFLAHHIMKHSITVLISKTVAIKEFTNPSTVIGLQKFLVMVNFYHRFIPSAAILCSHCTKLLQGSPKSYSGWRRPKQYSTTQGNLYPMSPC